MSQLPKKILIVYYAAASLFITINSILTATTMNNALFVVVFLPVTVYFVSLVINQLKQSSSGTRQQPNQETKFSINRTDAIIALVMFAVLVFIGIRSVTYSQAANDQTTTQPDNETIEEQEKTSPLTFKKTQANKKFILINISDKYSYINILNEPNINSEAVGKAKNGEKYEYVETQNDWYKIIVDGNEGYISTQSAKLLE